MVVGVTKVTITEAGLPPYKLPNGAISPLVADNVCPVATPAVLVTVTVAVQGEGPGEMPPTVPLDDTNIAPSFHC